MTTGKARIVGGALLLVAAAQGAFAAVACADLKAQIDDKLKAKNVVNYTLTVVPSAAAADGTVVGTCDGGKNKIVYVRGTAAATKATPAPAAPAKPPAAPAKK